MMNHPITRRAFGVTMGLMLAGAPVMARADGKVVLKLGTLAPEGSEWHKTLVTIGQRWANEVKGATAVELKIYPGGVAGDEGDMVRKMRIGQLHAATITTIGLSSIHKASLALQIPMMFNDWDELDFVREKVGPQIAKDMEDAGFVVLNWGDAGWVHFFASAPVPQPDDLRKQKLFVWAGDADSEMAWKQAKFNVVPLSSTDVLTSLRNGMVTAFQTTPLFALTSQWYKAADNMTVVNWTPLNGATVVSKKQWDKIDPAMRADLLRIAKEEGDKLKLAVRAMSEDAVKQMVARGLKVTVPPPAALQEWRKTAETSYPDIRGKVVPEKYFDQVQALVRERRATKGR